MLGDLKKSLVKLINDAWLVNHSFYTSTGAGDSDIFILLYLKLVEKKILSETKRGTHSLNIMLTFPVLFRSSFLLMMCKEGKR